LLLIRENTYFCAVKKIHLLYIFILISFNLISQEEKKEKRKKELRELSPDRPHQTESPHTVDVGHIMLETDLVNNTFYNKEVPRSATTGLFYFNLKMGFQKNMDVELISDALSFTRYAHDVLPATNAAFPDLTFRYKLNILGNDSGKTSIAIMPFITTSNFFVDKPQAKTGGIFVNMEQKLGEKYEIEYTGGLTYFSINPFFKQYEWFSTVSFTYPLYKTVHHFLEISERFNQFSNLRNNYSFDSGFTFTPTKNNQFDMGFYYFIPVKTLYIFIGTTIRI
jgi:hypothetical protein